MDQLHQSSRYSYPTVAEVAAALALARYWIPWELEAPVRHYIRVWLVLQGCPWERADWVGHALVARGRVTNGVGQPRGWDNDFDLSQWLPDADCPCCGKFFRKRWLDQGYCSAACSRRFAEIQLRAETLVGYCGDPARCQFCFHIFEPDYSHEIYCSSECRRRAMVLIREGSADADLAAKLKAARATRGVTQRQLARLVGCNRSLIDQIEDGGTPATPSMLAKLCEVLDIDPAAPALEVPPRICGWCSDPIPDERHPNALYCCRQHGVNAAREAWEARQRNGATNPNGHDHAHAANGSDPALRPDLAGDPAGGHPDQARGDAGRARVPAVDRTASAP
jgi:transcriptional regulator with XRE-family HTH domain